MRVARHFEDELAGAEKFFNLFKAKENEAELNAVTPIHFKVSIST